MNDGVKDEIFDPGRRNRIKEGGVIGGWRESRPSRHLFIESLDFYEGACLFAGLVGMAFANRTARAAARLSQLRRPGGTSSLGIAYPQRQSGHQDLNEGLKAHSYIKAITVPRVYFKSRDG
jgi:hypothetical protein